MAPDLLRLLSETVGTQLVDGVGSFLDIPESNMKGAVGAALPTLLAGMMQKSSTPAGACELMKLLDTPALDPAITGSLGSHLGGGDETSRLLTMGSDFLSSLFGDKLGSLVQTIASSFGLKSTSVSNLMALAAPMVLGALKGRAKRERMDAKDLADLLASQEQYLAPRLDGRVTDALGYASPLAFLSSLGGAAGRAQNRRDDAVVLKR